jgi:hypothetical protein
MLLAPGLPGALFFKLQKHQISKFLKNSKKNLDVAKYIHYDLEFFQYEIPSCVGSGKKDKLDKFWKKTSDTVHAPRSEFLFLPRMKYKIFHIVILHDGSVASIQVFFVNIFENFKYNIL